MEFLTSQGAGKLQQVTQLMDTLERDVKEKTLNTQRKSPHGNRIGNLAYL